MPNYKVIFTADGKEIQITVYAENNKEAVEKASKFFKVSVGEIKLKTFNRYK